MKPTVTPVWMQTGDSSGNTSRNSDEPFRRFSCVIMASGLGKRFGGNKLMASFHGAPLISRVLDATEGLFSRRVVVTRHTDVAEYCRGRGVQVVLHQLPLRSDTVRLGLEAVGTVSGCMFCPADQPLLRRETVQALICRALEEPEYIFRPAFENQAGAPILFPGRFFPQLMVLPDGKGGGFLTKKYPEQVRYLPVRDKYELMDVDTPEDLTILERQ